MVEKANFDDLAGDAVRNEPPRSEKAEEILQAEKPEAKDAHPVDAADFAGAGVAAVDGAMIFSFGSEGKLNQREVEGLLSLFQRLSDHFGLTKYIGGGKGLALMVVGKILAILFPRLADEAQRKHFVKTFFGAKDDVLSRHGKADGNAGHGAAEQPAEA